MQETFHSITKADGGALKSFLPFNIQFSEEVARGDVMLMKEGIKKYTVL